jgi:ATP-dependent Clp protease adapter protein ClpS/tetratricopeptide (TPR) repeat protein
MPDTKASRLPEKPDLAQERKRAKDLLKALRERRGDAIARLHSHHPGFAGKPSEPLDAAAVKLADAQLVIAREYGFPSWRSLKAAIERTSPRSAGTSAPHTVLIWNDDTTPMAFVVYLVTHIFQKSEEDAREIMLDTHQHGVGVCGVYDRTEKAEERLAEALALAREHGHALELTLARARAVRCDERHMRVELTSGRTLNASLAWFPKLLNASTDQRGRYAIREEGRVLSWPELKLTIPVDMLLSGPEGPAPKRSLSPPWIESCRAALAALSREDAPYAWAKAQHDLGSALFRLGERTRGSNSAWLEESNSAWLEEAVAALRAAVTAYDRAGAPYEWAKAQYDFAGALLALGGARHDNIMIQEAVTACNAALEEFGHGAPIECAEARRLLGYALVALGAHGAGVERFTEAVAAFRSALREHARGPLTEWTRTRHGLGNALLWLGTRESATDRIEEAIATVEPVLTDKVRERLPAQWALSAGLQGVALMEIAERRSDVVSARTAVAKLGMALAEDGGQDAQTNAYHQTQLTRARALLDRLESS